MKPFTLSFLLLSGLSGFASARTDLDGCVSTEVVIDYGASYLWYVPDSGEICTFLDCGGGRAPPKTNQPGCPLYSGTATVTASYIDGYGPSGKQTVSTTTATATTLSGSSASGTQTESSTSESSGTQSSGSLITAAPTSSPAVSMTTTTTSSVSSADTTAASSTPTNNAANLPASNVGVMALVGMVGAMML